MEAGTLAGMAYETYTVWLDRQPLASRSREAYRAQVGSYLGWLADTGDPEAALTQQDRRDWAVRDYKRQMKVQKRWSATTVNQALAAIDNFYRSRQMGRPDVAREQIPQVAPPGVGPHGPAEADTCGGTSPFGEGPGHRHPHAVYGSSAVGVGGPSSDGCGDHRPQRDGHSTVG